MKPKYMKITKKDIEGSYDLTEEALTRDLPPKDQWKEVVEIADDSYKLSDEDWTKKYGDRSYQDVFKDFLEKVRQEAEKRVREEIAEKINKVIIDLSYTAGFVFDETNEEKGDRWTFLKRLEKEKQNALDQVLEVIKGK